MLLVFVLLLSVVIFAQTKQEKNLHFIDEVKIRGTKPESSSDYISNMNFVLWFMGSKQTPNMIVLPVGTTEKKQFIISGTAPNRLLIKTFLKKAVNFESVIV